MTLKIRLAAIGITSVGLAAGLGTFAAEHSLHHYLPPFPRQGAVRVLENNRVVVWDVTWPKGVRGPVHQHYRDSVIFAPKGTIHSEEGISDAPRHAIVIQLK